MHQTVLFPLAFELLKILGPRTVLPRLLLFLLTSPILWQPFELQVILLNVERSCTVGAIEEVDIELDVQQASLTQPLGGVDLDV